VRATIKAKVLFQRLDLIIPFLEINYDDNDYDYVLCHINSTVHNISDRRPN